MMKIKFLILCILAGFLTIHAEVPRATSDTLHYFEASDTSLFLTNLDSMMNLWYVKQGVAQKNLGRAPQNRDTNYVPQFSDSVFKARIASINSVINLSYNNNVRSYIEMYCCRKRRLVEYMLGLSEYYFPTFERELEQYGVPQELKYLAIIESALNPRATSRANAVGLWQFMYSTGRLCGLKINSFVDERRDPVKSTHAAAKYLSELHNIFNDWVLALAAYNCGPGNVRKAMRRSGGKSNYWDIYRYLPVETRGYVPAYIAATYFMHFHKEHNMFPREISMPSSIDTIVVTERVHLKQIAEVLQLPIEQLRDLNPQYKLDIIPTDSTGNNLTLPADQALRFVELQDSIYSFNDSLYFNTALLSKEPATYAYSSKSSKKNGKKKSSKAASLFHVVKSGESLGVIAEKYGITIATIREANNLRNNTILPGQKLEIVGSIKPVSPEKESAAEVKTTSINTASSKKNKKDNEETAYYTVKQGETLWRIAHQYEGISEDDIMKWNKIKNPKSIYPGMKLKIKKE